MATWRNISGGITEPMKDKITIIVIGVPVRTPVAFPKRDETPKQKGRTKENGKDHYYL